MTQAITPDLRRWIVAQVQAGQDADAVLQSMKTSGWDEDVAIEAMETTLREHLQAQAQARQLPPGVPVPEPSMGEAPLYLDAGDRRTHYSWVGQANDDFDRWARLDDERDERRREDGRQDADGCGELHVTPPGG